MDALQVHPAWPSPSIAPPPPPAPVAAPLAAPVSGPTSPAFTTSAPELFLGSPSLPPAVEHEESGPVQPPIVTRAYEHTNHRGPELIGTGATRVLAAAGWLGFAICYTIAAIALSRSYRHITADNWRGAFDEIRWLMPVVISSFGMAYLGWVVWATLAAINGHRVAPLATSPFMAPLAYLIGPAAAAAGAVYKPEYSGYWLAGAIAWVCIGHGLVLLSLRSSARRIGADSNQFSRLLWFPLAAIGYRMIAIVVLPETSFNNSTWFAVLVAIDVTLVVATAFAVWRAMHSFDAACARDRYSAVENQLPAFMAAAHR